MKKTIILVGLMVVIALVSGCVQQQTPPEPTAPVDSPESTTSMEFTFANEAKFDTTLTAFIDGGIVYEKEMISSTTAGGYFGQEFEYQVLEVPDRKFMLKNSRKCYWF